ncbi:MAG: biliverdin-producing heme oxygenase [Burkholderiaceae bacterium]
MNDIARPSLAARLRQETQDLHRAAESTGAMAALLRGQLTPPAYVGLLLNLQSIYGALEAGLARHGHVAEIDFGALARGPALAADLHHLRPVLPAEPAGLAPATAAYVQRLETLAAQDGQKLVAHAYVRYLGDLHGGQVLKRLVCQALGAPAAEGTRFYDFGPVERVAGLVSGFRRGLDALPLSPDEADAFVAEARWAFQQHVALFAQLPH